MASGLALMHVYLPQLSKPLLRTGVSAVTGARLANCTASLLHPPGNYYGSTQPALVQYTPPRTLNQSAEWNPSSIPVTPLASWVSFTFSCLLVLFIMAKGGHFMVFLNALH